ncbi:PAS domain S-box protein [Nisaea acidiphila]|uniref:histidine kinase n=1 Tax=Nisaea acidiphila TaxID=1862145 RepID=A0A9J7AWM1_9PROT|nr:PAS domain S-box protein [Nisaea acidiphila]UUX51696.1 PAS domain S-box protein [Nisaea acidiphila]
MSAKDLGGNRLADAIAQRNAERIGRIGSWYWILETDEIVWSEEAFRLLGLTGTDATPRWAEFLKIVHPDDREEVDIWFRKAWKTDRENATECRIQRADGSVRWVEAREGPVFEGGKKTAIFGTIRDVTERVERMAEIQALNARQEELVIRRTSELQDEIAKREAMQAELALSEAMHRNIVDSAADAIVTIDVGGCILSANRAVKDTFGYDPDSLVGQRAETLVESGVAAKHQGFIDNYLRSGQSRIMGRTAEVSARRACGEVFPVELSVNEVKASGRIFFCAIIRDISERRSAELELRESAERLKESESNLRKLLDLSPVGITIVEPHAHKRLYANEAMAKMFMIPEGTPLSEWGAVETFADPKDLEIVRQANFTENPISDLELLRTRRDGSTWWCLHYSRPIVFAGTHAAIVWHLDISNRKRIEAELSEKEQQLRSTIDNAPAGFVLTDRAEKIVLMNDRMREILDVPAELVEPGRCYGDVLRYLVERGDFGAGNTEEKYQRALGGLRNLTARIHEYNSVSGKIFGVRRHPAGEGSVVTVAVDVTEQKESEERLRQALWDLELAQDELVQSEKMASLGGLVAGVAHEINTPVGTAVTAATHVREETMKIRAALANNAVGRAQFDGYLSVADEGTRIIESNLHRAAQLIRSFKQVAVDQSSEERRAFNVDSYLRETVDSLRPQLTNYPKVGLDLETDADVRINSFPGAFAQVLSNLFVNALAHGFDSDGSGTISIRTIRLDDQVRLTFEDDGQGMDADTRMHIFEPFFTTKRGSGGSGLGMHIVYNLVTTQLSGTIRCFSNPGEGTRFDITLPLEPEICHDK